jgi:hypothetical protein
MNEQFDKYNIQRRNVYLAKRFSEHKDEFSYGGKYIHELNDGGIGAVLSHLTCIKNWYDTSTEEYALFCEDDISFETVEYWNFTWEEFIDNLPSDWECVQLSRINNFGAGHIEPMPITLRARNWNDWGATCIMKRSYAKKILDDFLTSSGVFDLTIKKGDYQPLIENILYYGHGVVYSIPLFVECTEFPTTFLPDYEKTNYQKYNIEKKVKIDHMESREFNLNFWKECKPNIQELMGSLFKRTLDNFDWWGSGLLEPNKKEQKQGKVWVVENFYKDPYAVRDYALQLGYFDQYNNNGGFIGRRTHYQHLFPGLKESFEEIMGIKIREWESHGMNGRFQNCYAGEPLVYHCDSQQWAGMIYLTPEAPYSCGTTLWGHKKTRIRHASHPDIMQCFDFNSTLDRTPYEPVDVMGNVFNRLVIFDALSLHSASEYFGYNINNCRLWQMFFFD